MNKIRDNIYLSGWQEATQLEVLKSNGITTVLNVSLNQPDPDFWGDGIMNVYVGLGDCNYNKPHMKELAITALEKLLDGGETVLVHCTAGASRSPYVVGKYLAKKENRDLHEVMKEIHTLRPETFEWTPLNDE